MKILSVNTKYTKSNQKVALNVDIAPSKALLSKIKFDNIRIYMDTPCLIIESTNDYPSINKSDIDAFMKELSIAENDIKDDKIKEQSSIESMLSNLSESTGIILDE